MLKATDWDTFESHLQRNGQVLIQQGNRLKLFCLESGLMHEQKMDAHTPDELVHELRIQCNKLRYLMEFFMNLYSGKTIKPLIKSLKGLQRCAWKI